MKTGFRRYLASSVPGSEVQLRVDAGDKKQRKIVNKIQSRKFRVEDVVCRFLEERVNFII